MNNIGQPAEPKLEVVECAIVELLELAQRQGLTPADFIQLLVQECVYEISWQR
jgi:hypothetical protein